MNFINDFMELFEQLLFLLLKILELLKLDFVLPFDLLVLNFGDSDLVLGSLQFLFNVVTFLLFFCQEFDILFKLLHWFHNIVVCCFLSSSLLIGLGHVCNVSF